MRKPFIKSIDNLPLEDAHGGSGTRRLLLSAKDPISRHLQAMAKGYLPPKGVFDWHQHENIDEFFIVLQGQGKIDFQGGLTFDYQENDLIYIPANLSHRIENTGGIQNEFYFIRMDS